MLHYHISDIICMCTVSALFHIIVPFFAFAPPKWKYVPPHLVQTQYQLLFVHSWRNVPKSETNTL